jgi:hypothetical protein
MVHQFAELFSSSTLDRGRSECSTVQRSPPVRRRPTGPTEQRRTPPRGRERRAARRSAAVAGGKGAEWTRSGSRLTKAGHGWSWRGRQLPKVASTRIPLRRRWCTRGLEARAGVYVPPGHGGLDGLDSLFVTMADQWRGWAGERSWSSLEGELSLRCTHDGRGHVKVAVDLRPDLLGESWTARAVLVVWAGSLEWIAQRERVRRQRAGVNDWPHPHRDRVDGAQPGHTAPVQSGSPTGRSGVPAPSSTAR